MDISKIVNGINAYLDRLLPDEPPVQCARCSGVHDCKDVLGNGSRICFECTTPRELDAFLRRLVGAEPVS